MKYPSARNATHRLITCFSDWTKLKVAVSWLLKLKKVLKQQSRKRKEIKVYYDSSGVLISSKKPEKVLKKVTGSVIIPHLTLE